MKPRTILAVVVALTAATLAACGDDTSRVAPREVAATSTDGPLPAPAPGSRWLSWHDVAVQVPAAWDAGYEPQTDWCVGQPKPEEPAPAPYFALGPSSGAVLDIWCADSGESGPEEFGPAPMFLWAPHIVLEPSDGRPDKTLEYDGWTMTSRTVGDVRVRMLTRDADDDVDAAAILASARQFRLDDHGCAPTSPVQSPDFVRPRPFDVTAVTAADSISLCQYSRTHEAEAPALVGSRRIEGDAAQRLLHGLQEAPAGTGPDKPRNCVDDYYGDTAIAIRIHHDGRTDDVHAYYDWCFGNGTDDGTQHRELTSRTCAPLFAGTVRLFSYSSFLAPICHPD
ncbi:hypothetical protein [Nocardioides sp. MH1]|uniref:hypothetical protein n=1 Tax=Nocardioides sp. MH1 TaxID=3242490 RepID=UPI003522800C